MWKFLIKTCRVNINPSYIFAIIGWVIGSIAPAFSFVGINEYQLLKAVTALIVLVCYSRISATNKSGFWLVVFGISTPIIGWSIPDTDFLFCLFLFAPTFLLMQRRIKMRDHLADGLIFGLCIWLATGSWILDDLNVSLELNAIAGALWIILWGVIFVIVGVTFLYKISFLAPIVLTVFDAIRSSGEFPIPYYIISRAFPPTLLSMMPDTIRNSPQLKEWMLGLIIACASLVISKLWNRSYRINIKNYSYLILLIPIVNPLSVGAASTLPVSICAEIQPSRINIAAAS